MAEAAADEIGQQTEIGKLGVARGAFELEIAGGNASDIEHRHRDFGAIEMATKLLVGPLPAQIPEPGLADRVVEIAIERDGATLGTQQRELGMRDWQRRTLRSCRHFEIGDGVDEAARGLN